jgi:hypothetical protein
MLHNISDSGVSYKFLPQRGVSDRTSAAGLRDQGVSYIIADKNIKKKTILIPASRRKSHF